MTELPFDSLRLVSGTFRNPRATSGLAPDEIRELAEHIVRHGLLSPLLVTDPGAASGRVATVIGGQRRYRAIEQIFDWEAALDVPEEPPWPDGDPHLIFGDVDQELVIARAAELRAGVPVRMLAIDSGLEEGGIALADNVMRESLSSFEIAEALTELSAWGSTGVELAKLVGKSTTYVSRKLKLFAGAGPDLRAAWQRGDLTDQAVEGLAYRTHEEQARMLARGERPGRGPVARPGIDTVKDALLTVELRARVVENQDYARGATDALRWVTGEKTSQDFVELVEEAS